MPRVIETIGGQNIGSQIVGSPTAGMTMARATGRATMKTIGIMIKMMTAMT